MRRLTMCSMTRENPPMERRSSRMPTIPVALKSWNQVFLACTTPPASWANPVPVRTTINAISSITTIAFFHMFRFSKIGFQTSPSGTEGQSTVLLFSRRRRQLRLQLLFQFVEAVLQSASVSVPLRERLPHDVELGLGPVVVALLHLRGDEPVAALPPRAA